MNKRLVLPVLALVTMGFALPLAGCKARIQVQAKTAEAPPAKEEPKPDPPKPPVVGDRIVLPGELEFEVNRADLKDTQQTNDILNQLAKILKENPNITKLRIEGHTDSSGRAQKNQRLSQARAETVAKFLLDSGVEKDRLTAVGLGATKPLVDNDTPEHRAQNRRTEFHIEMVDGKPVTDENAVTGAPKEPIATK